MYLPKEIIPLVEATVRDYSEMSGLTRKLISDGKKEWLRHEVYRRSFLGKKYFKADFKNLSETEEEQFFMLFEKAIPELRRRDYVTFFALLGIEPSYVENLELHRKRPRRAKLGTPIPCYFEFDMDPRDNAAYIDLFVGDAFPKEFSDLNKVVEAYKKNKLDFEIEFTQLPSYEDNIYELRGVIKKGGLVSYSSSTKRRRRDKTDEEHNKGVEAIIKKELGNTPDQVTKQMNYLKSSHLTTLRSDGIKLYIDSYKGENRRIRIWRNEQYNETRGYEKFIKLINLFDSPKEFMKILKEYENKPTSAY